MTETTLTDADGTVRFRGTLDPSGGLPTGWTQAGSPATVDAHDGGIQNASVDLGANALSGDAGAGTTLTASAGAGLLLDASGPTAQLAGGTGLQCDDDAGSTLQATGTVVQLDAPGGSFVTLAPDQGNALNIKPKAGAKAINIVAGLAPAAVIDPNGVALISADSQPQVPAIPTAQDVVDALVTLGLVTQAP